MSGEEQGGQNGAGGQDEVAEANRDEAAFKTPPRGEGEDEPAQDDAVQARVQAAVSAALAEQRETVLRAQAEVQNMRRRCETDVEKAHKFALERFSSELLTVVDNLERALASVPEEQNEQLKSFCEGIELTHKGFLEIFNKFNIRQIVPSGEPFDPQLHQAVATVPNAEVEPNTVIDVMQKGYTLNDRVIRPAMVVVAKAPEAGSKT